MLHHDRPKTGSDDAAAGAAMSASSGAPSTAELFAEPPFSSGNRERLRGDIYSPLAALKLLNSHYLIGKSEQEVAIFRIRDDGELAFAPPEQFKLDVANIFVQPSGGVRQTYTGREVLEGAPLASSADNRLQTRRYNGADRVQSVARVRS